MASTLSNKIKFLMGTGAINFSTDSFKIILMASGFTFDKDTHHAYSSVSSSELAAGNGYSTSSKALSLTSITEDDTDDRLEVVWANVTWTASGGAIGPTPGACIFDDTHANDAIVGYLDFGGEQTQADGGTATISNIEFRLA
jgi:hypothetical protein